MAVTDTAPAAEQEILTPSSLSDALDSGFLPEDPHYRLTGEFKQEKETETPAVTEEASAASKGENVEDAPASETQEQKGPERTKSAASSESRWAKITRENKELRERLQKLETRQEPAPREIQQASQPAAEVNGRPKIDDVDPKTGQAKFKSWAEYESAKDDWLQNEAIRKFQETSAKTQAETQRQQQETAVTEKLMSRFDAARKVHADFDAVALNNDLIIPKGSVTDGYLLDSEHAGEVLYYLGQHPEVLEGFYGNHDPNSGKFVNKISPYAQARELTKIELQLTSKPAPAKPVTQAPRPPNQLSGKGAVGKDSIAQAVEEGDSETYIREMNARSLASRKRK